MDEQKWEVILEVAGEVQAEIMRGLLEAQGIPVLLIQEGAGRAYGINIGPMGQVQILTHSSHSENARQVIKDYYAGSFDEGIEPDETPDD
jgi:hypothetical protein